LYYQLIPWIRCNYSADRSLHRHLKRTKPLYRVWCNERLFGFVRYSWHLRQEWKDKRVTFAHPLSHGLVILSVLNGPRRVRSMILASLSALRLNRSRKLPGRYSLSRRHRAKVPYYLSGDLLKSTLLAFIGPRQLIYPYLPACLPTYQLTYLVLMRRGNTLTIRWTSQGL